MEHIHGRVKIKTRLCGYAWHLVACDIGYWDGHYQSPHCMPCAILYIMCMKCRNISYCYICPNKSDNVMKQNELCSTMRFTMHSQADLLLPHKTPQNCGMLNIKFIVSRFFLLNVIHNNIV